MKSTDKLIVDIDKQKEKSDQLGLQRAAQC